MDVGQAMTQGEQPGRGAQRFVVSCTPNEEESFAGVVAADEVADGRIAVFSEVWVVTVPLSPHIDETGRLVRVGKFQQPPANRQKTH